MPSTQSTGAAVHTRSPRAIQSVPATAYRAPLSSFTYCLLYLLSPQLWVVRSPLPSTAAAAALTAAVATVVVELSSLAHTPVQIASVSTSTASVVPVSLPTHSAPATPAVIDGVTAPPPPPSGSVPSRPWRAASSVGFATASPSSVDATDLTFIVTGAPSSAGATVISLPSSSAACTYRSAAMVGRTVATYRFALPSSREAISSRNFSSNVGVAATAAICNPFPRPYGSSRPSSIAK
ncbi:unnamed protein product [Phytophthora fragariaefolia]|uniref:Unnamed protein product n=1 Tax=Phytophthora fragariaefolia TaxID=1490495 RepID=A0A9W6Y6N2_9STRA|nr:unnamed protein product [Phytophthora fragariaefolia]